MEAAEEKAEGAGMVPETGDEEHRYHAFAYDVPPAGLAAPSLQSTRSQGSRSSITSTKRSSEPAAEEYEIRAEDVQIEMKLGEGYFGEVFQGSWLGQPIAAKILKGNHTSEEAEEEFVRETSLLNKLRHPNVIIFYGVCTTTDLRRMIVSELLHSSLFTFIHSGTPVPDSLWVRIARDIAAGLAYLHSRTPPIVHRDLSSSNVLLTADLDTLVKNAHNSRFPVAKISDFGLSRAMEWYMTQRTGNMFYMAVEVFQGEHYTEKADVYSLGITMSEMLTRTRPYGGLNPNKAAFQAASIGLRPSLPSDLLPMLKSLIERCWAQLPADRPSSSDVLYVLQQNMHLAEVTVAPEPDDGLDSFSVDDMSVTAYETFSTESLTPAEVAAQLIHCIQDDDVDAVRRMLSTSAVDVNSQAPTEGNKTALHFAATAEMTRLLCDYGARPYIVDDAGDTPLHVFYRLGLSSCIQVLLTNGCRDDMRNNDGLAPRECVDIDLALDRIGRSRSVDDMRWLLSQEAVAGASSEQLMRHLHQLAQLKAWNTFAILLEVYREPAVSFNGFELQREGFFAIADVLKRKRFRKIDLVNNGLLTSRDVQGLVIRKLISVLRACATTLVDLDIRENGIEDEPLLVEPIKQCVALKCLNGYRFLFDQPPQRLSFAFLRPSSSRTRELQAERLQLQARIAEISSSGRSLPTHLFLETKDNAARQLAIDRELLVEPTVRRLGPLATYETAFLVQQATKIENLKAVSFADVKLSLAGVREIAEHLLPLPLQELTLLNCDLTDESLGYLAEACANGSMCIEQLNVGYNRQVTIAGIRTLMEALRVNTTLRELQVLHSGAQEVGDAELGYIISEPLLQNRTLRLVTTTNHIISPFILRGDRGGSFVYVGGRNYAFPETYELLLPLNRTATYFSFLADNFNPVTLRSLHSHPILQTLDIQADIVAGEMFDILLEALPTLSQLEHLNLRCRKDLPRHQVARRQGLHAEMLQRLIETLRAADVPLRHLELGNNPLLHGRRAPIMVGSTVAVSLHFQSRWSLFEPDERGTVLQLQLDEPNRFISLRTDDDRVVEFRNFHVCQEEVDWHQLPSGTTIFTDHVLDMSGLDALCQYASSEHSQLARVWLQHVATDELPPQTNVAAVLAAAAESCARTVFYLQQGAELEEERVIGQRQEAVSNSNNVAVGDRIIVGSYRFDDHQRTEWLSEGVCSELPPPKRSEPLLVTRVDVKWDGTLRVDGYFEDSPGILVRDVLAPSLDSDRAMYPCTILGKADDLPEIEQRVTGADALGQPGATTAPEAAPAAPQPEEQKQEIAAVAAPAPLLVPAAPVPASTAARTPASSRGCDSIIPPHNPMVFNIQLCLGCSMRYGSNCFRCDARILGRGEPALGCPQCSTMNKQKCGICLNFVGVTGKAALLCSNCDRRLGFQKLCSWKK